MKEGFVGLQGLSAAIAPITASVHLSRIGLAALARGQRLQDVDAGIHHLPTDAGLAAIGLLLFLADPVEQFAYIRSGSLSQCKGGRGKGRGGR